MNHTKNTLQYGFNKQSFIDEIQSISSKLNSRFAFLEVVNGSENQLEINITVRNIGLISYIFRKIFGNSKRDIENYESVDLAFNHLLEKTFIVLQDENTSRDQKELLKSSTQIIIQKIDKIKSFRWNQSIKNKSNFKKIIDQEKIKEGIERAKKRISEIYLLVIDNLRSISSFHLENVKQVTSNLDDSHKIKEAINIFENENTKIKEYIQKIKDKDFRSNEEILKNKTIIIENFNRLSKAINNETELELKLLKEIKNAAKLLRSVINKQVKNLNPLTNQHLIKANNDLKELNKKLV